MCLACGRHDPTDKQLIGDVEDEIFPWYARIAHNCDGTLVSHRTVISTASCMIAHFAEDRKIFTMNLTNMAVELGFGYRLNDNYYQQIIQVS